MKSLLASLLALGILSTSASAQICAPGTGYRSHVSTSYRGAVPKLVIEKAPVVVEKPAAEAPAAPIEPPAPATPAPEAAPPK